MALSVHRWKLYGDVKIRRWSAQTGGVDHPHRFQLSLIKEHLQVYTVFAAVIITAL